MPTAARELLADRNFLRIWLIGGLSGISRWLEMLALAIFAFEATGSPFLVALLIVLRLLPLVLFGALVGALADRFDLRRSLLGWLLYMWLVALVMLLLAGGGLIAYWHVALAAFLSGLFWSTDMPLRRRIIGDVAGVERLSAAMGLDSATNNATRMLGPLIGGLLYQLLGVTGVYALAVAVFALCLLLARGLVLPAAPQPEPGEESVRRPLHDLVQVLQVALRDPELRRILAVTIVFNVWGFPFLAMVPVIGKESFGLAAGWVGALTVLEGAGALVGSLAIAALAGTNPLRFRRIYYFGTLLYLGCIFLLGWAPGVAAMALALVAVGLGAAGFTTMQSTLTYLVAPPDRRSRMFGLLAICIGSGLIGFANVGLMAELFGAANALKIMAVEGLVPLLAIGLRWTALRR